MAGKVLVGYATRSGSTQEVAEKIAVTLREQGVDVDAQSLRNVRSLSGYRMVIMGAPFYMFRWHRDALAFLAHHGEALKALPVAVFALGPFHDVEKEWQDVRAQLDKEIARLPWFAPVAHEVFGGRFDPARLGFPLSLVPAMRKMPASDIRDWAAIRAWAVDLAARFPPVTR